MEIFNSEMAAVVAGAVVGVLPLISIGVSCLLDSAKDEIMDVAAIRKNVMSRKAAERFAIKSKSLFILLTLE